jgi:HSP20 family protein
MPNQTAIQTASGAKQSAPKPLFVEAEELFDRMRELTQTVGRRAYDFFEARGREWGHELEDWFRAETELLRPVPVELSENDKQLTLRAEVPGFNAGEIKLSVEPRRLVLSGKTERATEEKTAETVYNERRSNQFCRALDLPAAIDPALAMATLKDGVLEITLPKTAAQTAVNVAVKQGE